LSVTDRGIDPGNHDVAFESCSARIDHSATTTITSSTSRRSPRTPAHHSGDAGTSSHRWTGRGLRRRLPFHEVAAPCMARAVTGHQVEHTGLNAGRIGAVLRHAWYHRSDRR